MVTREPIRGILLALAFGALLAAGVVLPAAAGAFLLGMLGFFWQSSRSENTPSRAAILGCVSGLVFMGAGFWWIFALHPLSWSGIHSTSASLLITIGMWSIMTTGTAACLGFAGLLIRTLAHGGQLVRTVVVASIWVLAEKLRAVVLTIIAYEPTLHFAPHFDLFNTGYALSQLRLFAHALPIGGEALASWCAAACVYALSTSIHRGRASLFLAMIGALLAFQIMLPLPNRELEGGKVTLGIVTGSFGLDFSEEGERTRVRQVREVLDREPRAADVLLLPENSLFLVREVLSKGAAPLAIAFRAGTIIDSGPRGDGHFLYFYSSDGRVEAYQKRFLMPQGEYLPSWQVAVAKLFGARSWLERDLTLLSPSVGAVALTFPAQDGLILGGLLCAEAVSPYLYRDLVKEGATLLVNPASHAVFRGSALLERQMEAVNRVRAIELDRYIVVAGNETDSLVISNRGETVARFAPQASARLDMAEAYANTTRTPFLRAGEWIIYVALATVSIALASEFLIMIRSRFAISREKKTTD